MNLPIIFLVWILVAVVSLGLYMLIAHLTRPHLRWIKIRPQHLMPENGECVLIGNSKEGHVGEARFHLEPDGAFWFEGTDDEVGKYKVANPMPTHWMPLPSPPKEFGQV